MLQAVTALLDRNSFIVWSLFYVSSSRNNDLCLAHLCKKIFVLGFRMFTVVLGEIEVKVII